MSIFLVTSKSEIQHKRVYLYIVCMLENLVLFQSPKKYMERILIIVRREVTLTI